MDENADRRLGQAVRTRLFKSGNSQAVRIPKALAFGPDAEVEIYRSGDSLVIRPIPKTLDDIGDVLASFPLGFMADGRDQPEYEERDWGRSRGFHEE